MSHASTRHSWILALAAAVSGCATPDRWHDVTSRYADHPAAGHETAVDPERLPTPDWDNPPPLPGVKQGRLVLALEQAVVLALRRNRELQVERYGPVIDGAFEQLGRGVYDPEFFSELVYAEETASETARSTGERFSVEGQDTDAELGVRQHLATGTDLAASVAFARSTSDRTPEQQEARVGLSVTQSLLEGFGPDVNLVGIRQAQLATQASQYELRGFVEALVAQTENAYWLYVLAGEQIAIFERSLNVARQQLEEVRKRIDVGDLPRNAAAAAEAEAARREQALIESRSTHENRRLRLLRLVNAAAADQFSLQVSPVSTPRTAPVALSDLAERLELADRMRPDLNEARLRREQHSLEVIRTRNGLLPKLALFIDLGKTGYAESFGEAFKNVGDNTYELAVGVRFSAYLGNRRAEARDLAARATSAQATAAVANLRNLVQLDVRLAVNETERARRQIDAGTVTRRLQEQTLQAEQERFSVGTSTSLLVAQVQRDLLVSQLAEIEAVVNYRIALVNLYLAEGSLLERRGISLNPADWQTP